MLPPIRTSHRRKLMDLHVESKSILPTEQTNLMEIEVKQGSRVANDIAPATLLQICIRLHRYA